MRVTLPTLVLALGVGASSLAELNHGDLYYVSGNYPKLTTPQWVGETGVEAVVVLAIDDMRGVEPYEKFLRPILERLKKIDGRAPVSIMTCRIDPTLPQLQQWLKEGVSLETHTIDHPCPLLTGDLAKSKSTYDRCVDLLASVPNNRPVAFRMPCCDSQNTTQPLFFSDIFNQTTAAGKFLTVDSSVFSILTPHDRYRKYIPFPNFNNAIEDYPFPYVIGNLCWEFPCVTPSDWQGQNLFGPANPRQLEDWQAALDTIVASHGVFTAVLHPYGWSTPAQWVAFIDYAVAKYGSKIKFLNFREAEERLTKNLLGGQPLRAADGRDNGVRLLDLNGDGLLDVAIDNATIRQQRIWSAKKQSWLVSPLSRANSAAVTRQASQTVRTKVRPAAPYATAPAALLPQDSLASIKLRPGFKAELVAAEPLVMDPVDFAWSADGKLWVVEMGDYPQGADGNGKAGGRIKFLEDTNGDGKYDKATLFLDNIGMPVGIIPWRKGVLITAAPNIIYAEDSNGDGKADIVRTLFSGFVEGNPQHRVNGLRYGLDNWVYAANGDSGGQVKSEKTGAVVDTGGHDIRIKPDDGILELESGNTQFGRNRDDWDNWFGCNNPNPGWHYVLPDHYLRRNPHVAPPNPRVDLTGDRVVIPASYVYSPSIENHHAKPGERSGHSSANSFIIYRDDLFGPDFAGNGFVSEPVYNLVRRLVVTPRGVTFEGKRAADEQDAEFLASTDPWFRPTTLRTGPDGALWVADMYRQVIEHPQWIAPEVQKKIDLRAGADKGRIYRIYPEGAKPRPIPRLDKLSTAQLVAALDSPNGWQRDTAQQLLIWRADKSAVAPLEKLFAQSKRDLARVHALCTLDGLGALNSKLLRRALVDPSPGVRRHAARLSEPFSELGPDLAKLIGDPDPQVRLQVAFSLGEWRDPRAGAALGLLALHDFADEFITAAVLSSINKDNLDSLLLTVMAANKHGALTEQLLRIARAMGEKRTLAKLLAAVAKPDNGTFAPWQFNAVAGMLDSLDDLKQFDTLFAAARATVADAQAAGETRIAAMRVLGREAADASVLAALLTPQTPLALQAEAITALARAQGPKPPPDLLRGWKGYVPALRAQVLDALLNRAEWTATLLDAIERGDVLPAEVDAARRQRLLKHARAAKLFADVVNPDRQKVLEAFRDATALPGDATHGAQLFAKTCAACHQFGGVGNAVGPDLASLGDKTPATLLISILDPNRAVEPRFTSYVAEMKSGLTLVGVITSEAGNAVTLAQADGKSQTILRNELKSLRSGGLSLMPEGLEAGLKPQDIADLIAHIRAISPAKPRKTFEGNNPELVRAGADGLLKLLPSNCEIYGSSIVLEKQYGNLGWWSAEDDQAVWSIESPHAGRYEVWLDWACDDGAAGNDFLLEAGTAQLKGKIAGTGNWDTYKHTKLGEIALPQGRTRVVFHSGGKIQGALMDLKSLQFTPVKSQP